MPTHEHEMKKGPLESVEFIDSPERREARVKELVEAGIGRKEAELIDDEARSVIEDVFTLFHQRLDEFRDKLPNLSLPMAAHSVSCLVANAQFSAEQLSRAIISHEMGMRVIEISSPEELHKFLSGLFGEEGK